MSADEKELFARMMECYAGFLSHADHQLGRFITFLEEIGNLENTLMFVCSDNGASAEGMLTGLFNEISVFNMEPETIQPEKHMLNIQKYKEELWKCIKPLLEVYGFVEINRFDSYR